MKLEINQDSFIFSQLNIPDVFFTEYLPYAKGDYVKVYLYLLFLASRGSEIREYDLSKKLAIPNNIIKEALTHWEKEEVIIRKQTGYVLCNLQETELHKLYKPKLTSSVKDAVEKNKKNQYRTKAIKNINDSFFQGLMPTTWYTDIDMWFEKYGFDEQVMICLFKYCFDKSALHRNYIQTVAASWSQNGVKTFSNLDSYYAKREKANKIKKAIGKKLGLSRNLSEYEGAYIEKWIIDCNYDMNIIEIALKRTTSKSNFSFDYLNKVILDWHDRGFKTKEQVEEFLKTFKATSSQKKQLEKKTSNAEYDRRKYSNDELSSLYANDRKVN